MIQWKKYDAVSKQQIVSRTDYLVTNGEKTVVARNCNLGDGVYLWLDVKGYTVKNVTHYAEINLPEEVHHE